MAETVKTTPGFRQGDLVRFANEQDGGPVHRIVSVMSDGMVELHDFGGYFAQHLFVEATDDEARSSFEREHQDLRLQNDREWKSKVDHQRDRAEKAEALVARIPDALNAAFSAGIEEREHGSARRQEKLMVEPEALRADARALIAKTRGAS